MNFAEAQQFLADRLGVLPKAINFWTSPEAPINLKVWSKGQLAGSDFYITIKLMNIASSRPIKKYVSILKCMDESDQDLYEQRLLLCTMGLQDLYDDILILKMNTSAEETRVINDAAAIVYLPKQAAYYIKHHDKNDFSLVIVMPTYEWATPTDPESGVQVLFAGRIRKKESGCLSITYGVSDSLLEWTRGIKTSKDLIWSPLNLKYHKTVHFPVTQECYFGEYYYYSDFPLHMIKVDGEWKEAPQSKLRQSFPEWPLEAQDEYKMYQNLKSLK